MSERLKISPHARSRMEQMDVDRNDVLRCIREANRIYPGTHPTAGEERKSYCDGHLHVVVDETNRRVVTVCFDTPGVLHDRTTGTPKEGATHDHGS
jgi:hypothetical protein